MSLRRERQIIAMIVVGYICLSVAFSLGPIFEGPDEIEHYRFIQTLVQIGGLPDGRAQFRGEYHQAPLYYLVASPLGWLFRDDPDFKQIDGRFNPYYGANIGIPGNDNKNLYVHTRSESFPYSGNSTARAVHAIRLLSIGLGVGTILASYGIFRLLWPDRPDRRLLAFGFVAYMPQFVYMSSIINNDALLFFLATSTLWAVLKGRRDGPSRRQSAVLGLLLGAALLTKVSAAVLICPVGLACIMDRRTWRYIPLTIGVALIIAGWWYIRNIAVYGDLTGIRTLLETWKTESIRGGAIALDVGIVRLPYSYQTFWARFGQGAVPVAQPIYVFFDLLLGITVLGALFFLGRKLIVALRHTPITVSKESQFVLVIATFGLAWIATLIYYASTAWSGNQGRYLLPGIAAWGALVAFGLDRWTPRRIRLPVALGGAALFATITTFCVFGYFLPAYQIAPVPEPVPQALALRFGDVAELIGMSPPSPKVRPGDTIFLTLYWRALRPTATSLQTYLHTVGSDAVKRDSLPGTGNLLSTDWLPGQTWRETYVVTIPSDTPAQVVFPLLAGLYDPATKNALPATRNDSAPVSPVIGRIAITGAPGAATPVYRFGGIIGLGQPRVSRYATSIQICLPWISLSTTPIDYQVFVHLMTDDGTPVTQADGEPKGGSYPTGAWTPGEVIEDCRTLDGSKVPPTGWKVAVGLYNLPDGLRLAALDSDGERLPDDSVIIIPQLIF